MIKLLQQMVAVSTSREVHLRSHDNVVHEHKESKSKSQEPKQHRDDQAFPFIHLFLSFAKLFPDKVRWLGSCIYF